MFLLERQRIDQSESEGVIIGPSVDNEIERFWRDLREGIVDNFKPVLRALYEDGLYDPTLKEDRDILSGIFILIIRQELQRFKNYHNSKWYVVSTNSYFCLNKHIKYTVYRDNIYDNVMTRSWKCDFVTA